MATRNERRRKAALRDKALRVAVEKAFALEAVKTPVETPLERFHRVCVEYPLEGESNVGKSLFRPWGKGNTSRVRDLPSTSAKLSARQSLPLPPSPKPLKGNGDKDRGEISLTWLDAKPYRTKLQKKS